MMDYNRLPKQKLVKIIEGIRSPRYGRDRSNELEVVRVLEALLLERAAMEAENQTLRESGAVLEESLRTYIDLFENAPIACLQLDTNGCVLRMNRSACALV